MVKSGAQFQETTTRAHERTVQKFRPYPPNHGHSSADRDRDQKPRPCPVLDVGAASDREFKICWNLAVMPWTWAQLLDTVVIKPAELKLHIQCLPTLEKLRPHPALDSQKSANRDHGQKLCPHPEHNNQGSADCDHDEKLCQH